jgi:hypothetical protein
MTIMNQTLVFEHQLRAHVQTVREKLEHFDEHEMSATHHTWNITFDAADGGKWRVSSYRFEVTVHGADLNTTADDAMAQVRRQQRNKQLPALIAGPTNG